jgi:hypothetical protein
MDKRDSFQKPRIPIAPGVFVVADKRAGKGWVEAWHVLNAAFKRCQTNNHLTGEPPDDDHHHHQSR